MRKGNGFLVMVQNGPVREYSDAESALQAARREVYCSDEIAQAAAEALRQGNPATWVYQFQTVTIQQPSAERPATMPSPKGWAEIGQALNALRSASEMMGRAYEAVRAAGQGAWFGDAATAIPELGRKVDKARSELLARFDAELAKHYEGKMHLATLGVWICGVDLSPQARQMASGQLWVQAGSSVRHGHEGWEAIGKIQVQGIGKDRTEIVRFGCGLWRRGDSVWVVHKGQAYAVLTDNELARCWALT
mgnify:CR=1 FL=1